MPHPDSLFQEDAEPLVEQPEPSKRKSTTFHEVALVMLTGGLTEVRGLRPRLSKHTLLRACHHLRNTGKTQEAQELYEFTHDAYPSRRGREKPQHGEERAYSVQLQDGIFYARIPVDILGVGKGHKVVATFDAETGVISVVRAPSPDEDATT